MNTFETNCLDALQVIEAGDSILFLHGKVMEHLVKRALVTESDGVYEITEAGRAYLDYHRRQR